MAHGQDALNVAFDLPTQLGLDSDDPRPRARSAGSGMAIDTLADMEEAFAGIPLDRVSVSLTINGMAAPITAMYYAVAEKQGAAADRVVTTPQNDILKEFVARGTWIYPVDPSLRLVGDLIEFSARHYPRSNPVSVCGYHIREAGCTTAQEMAYGLAIAAAYVEMMLARGMAVDEFAPRISFNFTAWGKIFEEVAKFRAGRRLYARMLRERFGAQSPKSWMFRSPHRRRRLRLHRAGAGEQHRARRLHRAGRRAQRARRPWRCPPTTRRTRSRRPRPSSSRCAPCRSAPRSPAPPTPRIRWPAPTTSRRSPTRWRRRSVEELAAVERMGGIVEAVQTGAIQAEVARQAYLFEQAMRLGRDPARSRSTATSATRPPRPIATSSCTRSTRRCAETQLAKLARVRARARRRRRRRPALRRLADAARGDANLMPPILEAVKAYATLGEIAQAMKERVRRAQGAGEMVTRALRAGDDVRRSIVRFIARRRRTSPARGSAAPRRDWSDFTLQGRTTRPASCRGPARRRGRWLVAPAGRPGEGAGTLGGVVVGLPPRHSAARHGSPTPSASSCASSPRDGQTHRPRTPSRPPESPNADLMARVPEPPRRHDVPVDSRSSSFSQRGLPGAVPLHGVPRRLPQGPHPRRADPTDARRDVEETRAAREATERSGRCRPRRFSRGLALRPRSTSGPANALRAPAGGLAGVSAGDRRSPSSAGTSPKRDGADKVTGRTRYLHDLDAAAAGPRQDPAHARAARADRRASTRRARAALPGVLAVLTGGGRRAAPVRLRQGPARAQDGQGPLHPRRGRRGGGGDARDRRGGARR